MKTPALLSVGGVRKVISSSAGRKPNLHWKLLFGLLVFAILLAIGAGAFVFWWSARAIAKETPNRETSRTFSKKQFESVIEYFADRERRFEAARAAKLPADPS